MQPLNSLNESVNAIFSHNCSVDGDILKSNPVNWPVLVNLMQIHSFVFQFHELNAIYDDKQILTFFLKYDTVYSSVWIYLDSRKADHCITNYNCFRQLYYIYMYYGVLLLSKCNANS